MNSKKTHESIEDKNKDKKPAENKKKNTFITIAVGAGLVLLAIFMFLNSSKESNKKAAEKKVLGKADSRRLIENIGINSIIIWSYKKIGKEEGLFTYKKPAKIEQVKEIVRKANEKTKRMEAAKQLLVNAYHDYAIKNKTDQLAISVSTCLEKNYNLRYILLMTDDPGKFLRDKKLLDKNNKCTKHTLTEAFKWLMTGHSEENIALLYKILSMPMKDTGIGIGNDIGKALTVLLRVIISSPYKATSNRIVGAINTLDAILKTIHTAIDKLISYTMLERSVSKIKKNTNDPKELQLKAILNHRYRLYRNKIREEEVALSVIIDNIAHIQKSASIDSERYISKFIELVHNKKKATNFGKKGVNASADFFINNLAEYIAMSQTNKDTQINLIPYLEVQLEEIGKGISLTSNKKSSIQKIGDLQKILSEYTDNIDSVCTFIDVMITLISFEMQYFLGTYTFRELLTEIAKAYTFLLEYKIKTIRNRQFTLKTFLTHTLESSSYKKYIEERRPEDIEALGKTYEKSVFTEEEKKNDSGIGSVKLAMEWYLLNLEVLATSINSNYKIHLKARPYKTGL